MLDAKTVRKKLSKLTEALITHQRAIIVIRHELDDVQRNCPHERMDMAEDLEQKYIFNTCSDCGKVFNGST